MKDSKEFKERFARWKSGELVYENGRPLPRYQDGKSRVDTFVEQLGPILYRSIINRGIENPDVVYNNAMRLFATETGYGTSRVAREQHNYGGVGWDGSKYYTYDSDQEFIDDYLSLLQRRYPKVLAAKTPREWAHELKVRGYYEAPEAVYANNMSNMNSLLTAMDKHWQLNANLYTDTPFKPAPVRLPELPTILSINETQSYQPTVKGRVLPEVVVYGTDRRNSSTMPSVQDTLTNPYYYNMLKDWGLIDDDDDISSYTFYNMLGKGRVFPKFKDGKNGDGEMNYQYRGTVYDDSLKNEGITNIAELPEIIVTGKDRRPAWKKMYQNKYLGNISLYYDRNVLRDAIGFVPGVSDALDGVEAADAFVKGDYTTAGVGALMLALPNFLEKPLRYFKRVKQIKKLQHEMDDVFNSTSDYDVINGSAKNWFDLELTYASPFRVRSHNGQTVGDVIDYNLGLYGGGSRPLSELTENQRYSIAKQTANNAYDEMPHSGILIHMDETGPQPVSRTGFVPKNATNSSSVWNKSLSGLPEIWWNDGNPYYSAKQYRDWINIPQTIVAKKQALEDAGLKFNSTASRVFHAPGEVPFGAVDYGLRPNIFGWFDRMKFANIE